MYCTSKSKYLAPGLIAKSLSDEITMINEGHG